MGVHCTDKTNPTFIQFEFGSNFTYNTSNRLKFCREYVKFVTKVVQNLQSLILYSIHWNECNCYRGRIQNTFSQLQELCKCIMNRKCHI